VWISFALRQLILLVASWTTHIVVSKHASLLFSHHLFPHEWLQAPLICLLHFWETLKNSSMFNERGYNILGWTITLCTLSFLPCPLIPWFVNLLIINNMFRGAWSIHNCIPNALVNWINEKFRANFPKLVVNTTKHRQSMCKGTFCKRKLVFSHFKTILGLTWIIFKNLALDTNWVMKWIISQEGGLNCLFVNFYYF